MSILMQSPMVEHFPLDKGFTILNVPFEDLEIIAPTLKFQVMEAGPTEFLVAYQATDKHRVKVKVRGKVIDRFWVTKSAVPAPMVEHHPLENVFSISNVPFEDLEVVAPTLKYQVMEAGPTKFLVAYQATDKHRVKVKVRGKVIDRFWVTKGAVPEYGAQMANIQPGLVGDCYKSKEETNPKPIVTGADLGHGDEPVVGADATPEAKLKARMKALAGKYPGVETVAEMISLKVEGDALEVDFAKAWKNFGIPPRSKLSWKRLGLLSTRRMYALRCR
eukprot:36404_1